MIITVSGLIGSGKTTLAKRLSEKFNLEYISPGSIMRKMSEKEGISLIEFSRCAEKNPEIDRVIDEKQTELAKKGNCVVDGRLSAYLLEPNLSIWLKAPIDVRVERVSRRDSISQKAAREHITLRENSERKRYWNYYNIDIDNLDIYDLIIDTNKFGGDEMLAIVSCAIEKIRNSR
ncbi:MAG TPA: cytidylate kinase [Candidatus Altiarchaeales archaeon]|nr:cytidylate kinase [Candidatus Altiarchaeales archaeon]